MKNKLYLFTNSYPYGNGEAFIENEISFLADVYDVTIISSDVESEFKREVPEDVNVMRIPKPAIGRAGVLAGIVRMCFSGATRKELKDCLSAQRHKLALIKQSAHMYQSSRLYLRNVTKFCGEFKENTILYFYWNTYKVISFLMMRKAYSSCKLISRIHGFDLYNSRNSLNHQPFKYLNSNLDCLFFLSNSAKAYYKQAFDASVEEYSKVIGLGVRKIKDQNPSKWERQKNTIRLCSCSRAVPVKRIDLIVDALQLVDGFKVEWTHLGDGELLQEVQEYAAKKLGNKQNITFHFAGAVSNSEIHQLYNKNCFDLYILTSESEGVPVSIMEALSYGIPVIATDVGGIREMIDGSGNILLNACPSPQEIAKAIISIYNINDANMTLLRNNNTRIWKEKYDSNKVYPDFIKTIQNL